MNTSTTDHLTLAIEDVDTSVAALNTQIDQLRDRVDALVDARVQLVAARAAIAGSATIPLPADGEPSAPPPKPQRAPKPPSSRKSTPGSKYDLAEVARIAKQAAAEGLPMGQAVLDGIDECPTIAMAGFLVKQARDAGHDIPKRATRSTTPKPASPKPAPPKPAVPVRRPEEQVRGKVFRCDTCDHTSVAVADLTRHTLQLHRRNPLPAERTPRDAITFTEPVPA